MPRAPLTLLSLGSARLASIREEIAGKGTHVVFVLNCRFFFCSHRSAVRAT